MLTAEDASRLAKAHKTKHDRIRNEMTYLAPLVERAATSGHFYILITPGCEAHFRDIVEIQFRYALQNEFSRLGYRIEGDPALSQSFTIYWNSET